MQHLHKRDYIRKLTKDAKQAEKAAKGLRTMIQKLEAQIYSYQTQLEEIDKSLVSGQIALREYESRKSEIQKQISEYQSKLEDKSEKLRAKEQELDQLTKDASNARSVIQPFRNYNVDFTAPQITEKPPMFCTDKWVERQNQHIAKQFTTIVRKIESLYRNDAARQVEAAQRNVLADYGELFHLRNDVKMLAANYDDLKSTFETMLDQMADHSIRSKIFAIADALICGTPISMSSSGGGGNSSSDLRWDGRRPDEEEGVYRRRCLMFAMGTVKKQNEKKSYRRR